ncbi:hypothetical protein NDU88_002455, partial [Pleurodeles waltl]
RWTLDRSLLLDEEVRTRLHAETEEFKVNMGSAPFNVVWDTYKAVIRGILINIASYKNKPYREELELMEEEMKICRGLLLSIGKGGKQVRQQRLDVLKHQVEALLQARLMQRWEASKLAHFENGENPGKLLAWKTKRDQVRNSIKEIEVEQGQRTRESVEIKRAFGQFFSQLYTEEV